MASGDDDALVPLKALRDNVDGKISSAKWPSKAEGEQNCTSLAEDTVCVEGSVSLCVRESADATTCARDYIHAG